LCEQTTEIVSVLENEELASTPESAETRVRAWLDGQGLGVHTLVRLDTGAIQVRLPAGSFGADDALRLSQVGSFVMLGDTFFHVWCADRDVRRRALLERVDTYFGSRPRLDAVEAAGWLKQVGRQLMLGDIGLAETRLMAAEAGLPGLAAQLGELIDAPTLRRG
jgi:signal transduction histidine kinase